MGRRHTGGLCMDRHITACDASKTINQEAACHLAVTDHKEEQLQAPEISRSFSSVPAGRTPLSTTHGCLHVCSINR
jgi:hypothetical protein